MKSLLSKKFVLISLITVLLIGTGIATTLAYLRSTPDELTNTFTIGNVTTKIVEDFRQESDWVFNKEPIVVNVGRNDCYVRARVVCSPEDALQLINLNTDKWEYNAVDGFYYYEDSLKASTTPNEDGESTAKLFDDVKVIDNTIDGFEVTVYQEAVQAEFYDKNGNYTTDSEIIWYWYDKGTVPQDMYDIPEKAE